MAFPVVQARAESNVTTAGTSHAVTKPTGTASGDLWVIFFGHAVACTLDALAGWTELVDTNAANSEKILYRLCDGTEGASVTFTSSASTKSAHLSYRISGTENPATQAPQLSTVATGTSTQPNATIVTPTGGAKDYLWITAFVTAGEEADDDTWGGAAPTNYANAIYKTTAVAGTAVTNCSVAGSDRTANAASEDAGVWGANAQSLAWRAWTIAVHPSSTVTTDQTVTAVARVQKTVDQTKTAVGRIQKTVDQTVTALARVTKTVDRTVTSLARVTATTDRTVTALADILKTVDRTVGAIASIQKTVDQTVGAAARIQKTVDQTVTSIGRVQKTTDQTVTAVANIATSATDRTVTAVARIQKTVDQTTTALGRIQKTVDQTVGSLGRVTKTADQTVGGLARIEKTVDRTVGAAASVLKTTDRTLTAVGKITVVVTTDKTVASVGNILKTTDQTVSSAGRIEGVTSRTVGATARIYPNDYRLALKVFGSGPKLFIDTETKELKVGTPHESWSVSASQRLSAAAATFDLGANHFAKPGDSITVWARGVLEVAASSSKTVNLVYDGTNEDSVTITNNTTAIVGIPFYLMFAGTMTAEVVTISSTATITQPKIMVERFR